MLPKEETLGKFQMTDFVINFCLIHKKHKICLNCMFEVINWILSVTFAQVIHSYPEANAKKTSQGHCSISTINPEKSTVLFVLKIKRLRV